LFVPKYEHSNLFHLISGHAVSTLGSSIYLLGVTLYLKDLTGSGVVLGVYHFLALLPPVLIGPFGGALVDAFSRRRVLVVADLSRGVIMLLLALIVRLRPGAIGAIWVLTFIGGFAHALFVPAARAILPEIVPPGRLRRSNALRTGITQLANLGGNALGGLAYVLLGLPLLLLVNGLSFIASAIEETRIRTPGPPLPAEPKPTVPVRRLLRDAREGLRFVLHHPGIRTLALTGSAVQFIAPPLVLSLPFVVADVLRLPERYLGYYFALMLAGGITGFVLLSVLNLSHRGEYRSFFGALLLFAVAVAAGGVFLTPAVLAVVLLAAGFSIGVATVLVHTVIQRSVDTEKQGRVFAIIEMMAGSSAPLAYLAGGIVIDLVLSDIRRIYLIVALLVGLVALGAGASRRLRVFFLATSEGAAEDGEGPRD
jgi:MFS transporter, DHA3 family, macrolide efflux protein